MIEVLAEYDPDEVLPFVGNRESPKKEYTIGDRSFQVRMTSLRLRTFKRSQTCVICGLVGTKMLLERFETHGGPHFNFYGVGKPSDIFMSHPTAVEGSLKSNLVLFTKDHILPKSAGGRDTIDNMQTMCVICNGLKKNVRLTNKLLRILREYYDEHTTQDRKKLIGLLDAKRKQLKERASKNRKRRNRARKLK